MSGFEYGCAGLEIVRSRFGHDGFLTEAAAVATLLEETMRLARG